MTHDPREPLAALASLGDATRRALYEYVASQDHGVGRDEAATATKVSRSLAAYHLDRLVDSGLLRARFARPEGRGGPGAGRPAKLYERPREAVEVSLPQRNYQLAARAFAEALVHHVGVQAPEALRSAARPLGRSLIEAGKSDTQKESLAVRLAALGYEPFVDEGCLRLRNCLFADLAAERRELTCSMNLGLIEGALEALGDDSHACLEPGDDRCCVAVHRAASDRSDTSAS